MHNFVKILLTPSALAYLFNRSLKYITFVNEKYIYDKTRLTLLMKKKLRITGKCLALSRVVLSKENRIHIRVEFTRKKCKTVILLYCFHTAGVHHIFMLYNLLGPGISFYRKPQIIVKRKPK